MNERLYPNIIYFNLKRDLMGCPKGTQVTFGIDRMCIQARNGIDLPPDFAIYHPEYFKGITSEVHRQIFKKRTIKYFMEQQGRSRKQAAELWERCEVIMEEEELARVGKPVQYK